MVEADVRAYLLADAAIAAAVATRIYHMYMPPNPTVPAIVYQRATSRHPELLDGSTDLKEALWQVTAYATTGEAAAVLCTLVIERMLGVGGTNFQKGGVEDERSDYENDTKFFKQEADVRVFYPA